MRAKDFIREAKPAGKIRKNYSSVSQGALKMRDKGGYDRTYHLNRIMMAAGMADGKSTGPVDMDSSSWYEKYNTAHPYTDEEYKMMQAAFNTIPTDGAVADKRHKSKEPNHVNKVSPVPSRDSLKESVSLKTTLTSITNDIGTPISDLYSTMSHRLKVFAGGRGNDASGWSLIAAGLTSKWVETYYFNKLQKDLYDLVKFAPGVSAELKEFLSLNLRKFGDIANNLPEILVSIGGKIKHQGLFLNSKKWIQSRNSYKSLLQSFIPDEDTEPEVDPRILAHNKQEKDKASAAAQQNQQVEAIINQVLMRLPKSVAGDVRNAIAKSANKLAALQAELKKRNINLNEDFSIGPGWKWQENDIVMSNDGKTYVILGKYFDKIKDKAMYRARSKGVEGSLDAALAHKNMVRINNEAATVGATSSGNIATVSTPHLSPGSARGKTSYTGTPGKSGTKAPPQPKPKSQKPTDNALNMKSSNIFGGKPIKR